MSAQPAPAERPVDLVRGTRDWLPEECMWLVALEHILVDRFARAGYEPIRTPVLELTELHERKSGAGIVAKLFELAGAGEGVCLRPELTAGIVRAYTTAPEPPTLPWRVSHAGPVFRYETPRPDRLREFEQVGVERLGDSGPLADAEVIWLADWSARQVGVRETSIRIGHVGLILEMLQHSGLPAPTRAALVEMLSEAATEGQSVQALEQGLNQLAGWLQGTETPEVPMAVDRRVDDRAVDRLFQTLVPVVIGRRSGHEIVHRLRRKWHLGHDLLGVLEKVREQIHAMADIKGRPDAVLKRLEADYAAMAPDSVAALRSLTQALQHYGIAPDRVELDLGFGRGIGFYSQMVFEITAQTPSGPVEICGGGRYDGLARVLGSDRDDRGVGFAFGLERLGQVLEAQGLKPEYGDVREYFVVPARPDVVPHGIALARRLRDEGFIAPFDYAIPARRKRVVEVRGPIEAAGSLWLDGQETSLAALLRREVRG